MSEEASANESKAAQNLIIIDRNIMMIHKSSMCNINNNINLRNLYKKHENFPLLLAVYIVTFFLEYL